MMFCSSFFLLQREPTQPTYENLDFEGRQQCGQIQVHPYKYRAE